MLASEGGEEGSPGSMELLTRNTSRGRLQRLNVSVLRQNDTKSDPYGGELDYRAKFSTQLDYAALKDSLRPVRDAAAELPATAQLASPAGA